MPQPPEGSSVARCTRCDAPAFAVGPDGAFYVKCGRQGCNTWHKVVPVLGLERERDGRETAVVDGDRRRVRDVPAAVVRDEPPPPPPSDGGGRRGPYRPG